MADSPFPFSLAESAFAADGDFIMSIIVRTALVTIFVVLVIRWMGHKGLGQLNMYELIILIGLGSAIGDPMIYQEMSLPHAFTSIVIVVALFKVLDYLTMKSKRFSRLTTSKPILLAKNGQIIREGMRAARFNDEEYRSLMRLHGIRDLSEVDESYLEINGQVSFLKRRS